MEACCHSCSLSVVSCIGSSGAHAGIESRPEAANASARILRRLGRSVLIQHLFRLGGGRVSRFDASSLFQSVEFIGSGSSLAFRGGTLSILGPGPSRFLWGPCPADSPYEVEVTRLSPVVCSSTADGDPPGVLEFSTRRPDRRRRDIRSASDPTDARPAFLVGVRVLGEDSVNDDRGRFDLGQHLRRDDCERVVDGPRHYSTSLDASRWSRATRAS